jgi:DNA polymerase-3 subunit delta'
VSWKRIRGHDALIAAFQRVIRRGRLAHAYLFTGPPGVGKKLFATELGKALLCEAPDAAARLDACDRCPACLQIDAGTHPDFAIVRRPEEAHEFPIELMRELCQRFALKPARGKGKVVILDDADDLNEESANCFLKTLEEPPPLSVLILIGSSADRQLPTIVSRCQVVNFARLPPSEVAAILKAEGIEDEALLARLLRASEGSPGVARDLSDPALWEFRTSLIQALTSLPVESVQLSKTWMAFVEEAGKESAAQRHRAAVCVGLLLSFLQDALRLSLGRPVEGIEPDERKAQETLAGRLDPERLLELMDRCLQGEFQIDRRVQLVLVLESLSDALGEKISITR